MISYEIIGTIAVVQIPEGVNEEIIAKKIMEQNKNIKTVAVRVGEVSGPYRIKKVRVIKGENTTLTIHKENNVRIIIDINKAYYSPRLQTERLRVMNEVRDNDEIIDLFAGVGPFTIAIAKNTKARIIYAIDHNPNAIELLKENIKLNKVSNVKPILGDSLKVINELPVVDKIIMNAPRQNKPEYLDIVKKKVKKNGLIYYYTTSESIIPVISELRLIKKRIVTRYAPGKTHNCLIFKKTK